MTEEPEVCATRRELLTASRQSCLLACPRKHFWRYEAKLAPRATRDALRFGTAWHAALEARFKGFSLEDCFAAALETSTEIPEFEAATLSALLAAYWAKWGSSETLLSGLNPEVEFCHHMDRSLTFDVAGKIDGVGMTADGRVAIIEHKTCGEDISPDSDYWQRLLFNPQILQYVDGARTIYPDVDLVIYDVCRKPTIKPLANVPMLDGDGLKIVFNKDGDRVYKKDGKPKQTADKDAGEYVFGAPETPEAYRDRLYADATERPDYYFARREVPILNDAVEAFFQQRVVLGKMILAFRQNQKRTPHPADAWPRNCNGFACRNCEYAAFCLVNSYPDANFCPPGFEFVQDPNTELQGVK